jgi:hypothetical protein
MTRQLFKIQLGNPAISTFLTSTVLYKALQKMEFSKLFVIASFRIVWLPKFVNFSKISGLCFCENSLEIRSYFRIKNPVFEAKPGVSKHSEFTEYSEFVLFQTFQKL